MKRLNPKSKTYKMFRALNEGEALTASQATKRFGIGNVRAEASRIRYNGYVVNTRKRVAGNGVRVTEYVMGSPSRELIAAGYRALSLGL